MATVTDNAVCIRRWDYSETSQTVSLFTEHHGTLRGLAKGAKREKGSFSGGIDILTRGQIVAIVKPGRDLATLTQWSLQEVYRSVRVNLRANRAALYMADLVHQMVREADPHPELFDALCRSLGALDQPEAISGALLSFQWILLAETGYQPELAKNAETGQAIPDTPTMAFSARAGGVVADTGEADRWRVRRETVALLRQLSDRGIDFTATPGDAARLSRANRLLAAYIREILGTEPPAMRWAFPDVQP